MRIEVCRREIITYEGMRQGIGEGQHEERQDWFARRGL